MRWPAGCTASARSSTWCSTRGTRQPAATGWAARVGGELGEEATGLGRLLHRLLPADAETAGLLALMLLHHSRAAARQDSDGRPVPLAGQDRALWDRALIAEGTAVLDAAMA